MLFDRHTHEILTLRQVRILFFRIVFNMLKTHVSVKVGGSQKSEPFECSMRPNAEVSARASAALNRL